MRGIVHGRTPLLFIRNGCTLLGEGFLYLSCKHIELDSAKETFSFISIGRL